MRKKTKTRIIGIISCVTLLATIATFVLLDSVKVSAAVLLPPTDLTITDLGATSAQLDWVAGTGSTQTLVRVSRTSYPASPIDGELLFLGAGNTTNHIGLALDTQQYFYSAWGEDGGSYSDSYVTGTIGGTMTHQIVFLLTLALFKWFAYWHREKGLYVLAAFASIAIGFSYISTSWEIGVLLLAWGGYDFFKAAWDKSSRKAEG